MFSPLEDGDIDSSPSGKFLRLSANEEHPVDRHCKCGRILLDPYELCCEHCAITYEEQPLVRIGDNWLTPETAEEVKRDLAEVA
jgi:hypothetical protein